MTTCHIVLSVVLIYWDSIEWNFSISWNEYKSHNIYQDQSISVSMIQYSGHVNHNGYKQVEISACECKLWLTWIKSKIRQ